MNSKSIDPNSIHLIRVRLFKSNIEVDHKDESIIERLYSYSFSFNQKSNFFIDRNLFLLNMEILLEGKDEFNEILDVNGEFGIEFLFKIDNLPSLSTKEEDGNLMVEELLGITLMAIAYSTARGIILQATQSSMLEEGVILPVIDPRDLLYKLSEEEE